MGNGDHHRFIRDHIHDADLAIGKSDLCSPRVTIFFFDLRQLQLDDLFPSFFPGENIFQVFNGLQQSFVLLFYFKSLQSDEALQAHFQDGLGLQIAQAETAHQAGVRLFDRLRIADQLDDFIEVIQRDQQSFEDVRPFFRFFQFILRAAHDDIQPKMDKLVDQLAKAEGPGTAIDQGDVVDAKGGLQRGKLIQLAQHNVGNGIPFQFDDDTDALPAGFVLYMRDAFYFVQGLELVDRLDQVGFVDLVRDLLDDDHIVAMRTFLDFGDPAQDHSAASCLIRFTDAFHAIDNPARGKIRGLDMFHQFIQRDGWILHDGNDPVCHLMQIVRHHIGGHTDGNTAGAIDQQRGNLGR